MKRTFIALLGVGLVASLASACSSRPDSDVAVGVAEGEIRPQSAGECTSGSSLGGCFSDYDWSGCQSRCHGYGYGFGWMHNYSGGECGSAWACCCTTNVE